MSWLIVVIVLLGVNQAQPVVVAQSAASVTTSSADKLHATTEMTTYLYLPLISNSIAETATITDCDPTGETYGSLDPIDPAVGDMSQHPDMNLAVRGYTPTTAYLGLVDYAGNIDPNAPQLYTLFDDQRTPTFNAAYQVYRWDWTCNCRGEPITKWDATLLGMETTPGEIIHLPNSGYDVGGGYGALVLYAEPTRLTLKYTREDNVISGYTLHLENICVDANLLALYQQLNAAGRAELPALWPGQPIGRARGAEIDAAIRDSGSFLDPRTRKDWWQGR
ncbi:MAG TPA: hypothetical protein VMP08_14770 [Anaerolineae bacterium]|nr:hypothetical protein [Anaerolineae bacterium]